MEEAQNRFLPHLLGITRHHQQNADIRENKLLNV
jgi:hypothetical protein